MSSHPKIEINPTALPVQRDMQDSKALLYLDRMFQLFRVAQLNN